MADRGDTHYFTPTLNKWFLFSSLFLLLATVWMMLEDWNAPWKKYQREFRDVERTKAEAELASLEAGPSKQKEEELKAVVDAAEKQLTSKQGDLDAAKAKLFQLKGELYVKEQAAKFAKADFDWTRYLVEEHRTATGNLTAEQERIDKAQERVNETSREKETADLAMKDAQKRVDDLTATVSAAEKA